ncbi:MAG: small, acid-soluble spore protein, alpha/beta type [Lachnospiraceae bacterium]|nr:small, acid-soluble spore protein, alpha/beta type [Lachnospiraceae bacterium]
MPKKENIPDLNNLSEEEKIKLEIAEEIGVFDKVMATGWRSLSAKESGRIGGLLARRRKNEQKTGEQK